MLSFVSVGYTAKKNKVHMWKLSQDVLHELKIIEIPLDIINSIRI